MPRAGAIFLLAAASPAARAPIRPADRRSGMCMRLRMSLSVCSSRLRRVRFALAVDEETPNEACAQSGADRQYCTALPILKFSLGAA